MTHSKPFVVQKQQDPLFHVDIEFQPNSIFNQNPKKKLKKLKKLSFSQPLALGIFSGLPHALNGKGTLCQFFLFFLIPILSGQNI